MEISVRSQWRSVGLETTLLVHGVPKESAPKLHDELGRIIRAHGADPTLIGVLNGQAIVGMTSAELSEMLQQEDVAKANTANLGLLLHRGASGATTVSGTMELAAMADVRVFATGGVGLIQKEDR